MKKIKGIWISLLTPFDAEGNLDLSKIEGYIKFVDKPGIDGFLVGGSVGEGLLLSAKECDEYIKEARKFTNKPIISCIAAPSLLHALEKIHIDADAFLLTPPIYFRPSEDGIFEYIEKICHHSNKPVLLYNNPSRVGCAFSWALYERLAGLDKIIGVKECCPPASWLPAKKNIPHWSWLAGDDPNFFEFLINGAVGLISTLANLIPESAHSLLNFQDKNFEHKSKNWVKKANILAKFPNPILTKALLSQKGIMKNLFRAPLSPISEEKIKDLGAEFYAS